MSTRKMLVAFVTVLLLAAIFAGVDAWKASAQGPDGNNPCGQTYSGHGMGMMGSWNNQQGGYGQDCDNMWGGQYMIGHQGMMGGWNMQGGMMGHMGQQGMMGGHMMGGWNNQGNWASSGMMNGWNSQQDQSGQGGYSYTGGYGMMGGWTPPATLAPAGTTLSLDEAVAVAEAYIAAQNNSNLALGEVMQFSNNFYAQAVEVEGGRSAFEFLIDPTTAIVYPEPGPNMMWNVRYGMHAGAGMMGQWNVPAGADGVEMTMAPDQARESAQQFLDTSYPGLTVVSEADTFYGYYTFEVLQGENVVGMISVNGYTGEVWVHTWHGDFVAATEVAD